VLLCCLCNPDHHLIARLSQGRCFAKYRSSLAPLQVETAIERRSVYSGLVVKLVAFKLERGSRRAGGAGRPCCSRSVRVLEVLDRLTARPPQYGPRTFELDLPIPT
jgi:hypothetical protein